MYIENQINLVVNNNKKTKNIQKYKYHVTISCTDESIYISN